jgi:hypothetical protein
MSEAEAIARLRGGLEATVGGPGGHG